MYGKSPMMKKLIGKQNNLPEELKAKIIASPAKKYKSDAQRKAVHASKAEKSSAAKMYGKSPMKQDTGFAGMLGETIKNMIPRIPPKTTITPEQKKSLRDSMKPAKRRKDSTYNTGKSARDMIPFIGEKASKKKPPYKKPVGPRA